MNKDQAKRYWIAAAFSALFVAIAFGIFILAAKKIVTVEMAALMFIGEIGMYFGFGVLIAVYRFVAKLG